MLVQVWGVTANLVQVWGGAWRMGYPGVRQWLSWGSPWKRQTGPLHLCSTPLVSCSYGPFSNRTACTVCSNVSYRYDPSRFRDDPFDDRNMVAGWRQVEAEEKRSQRLGEQGRGRGGGDGRAGRTSHSARRKGMGGEARGASKGQVRWAVGSLRHPECGGAGRWAADRKGEVWGAGNDLVRKGEEGRGGEGSRGADFRLFLSALAGRVSDCLNRANF